MHISKLSFKRGISSRQEKDPLKWTEAQIEITLSEKDSPDLAKELADTLFKAWGLEGNVTIKKA